jgi:nitrite reductase (NADH) small subunit
MSALARVLPADSMSDSDSSSSSSSSLSVPDWIDVCGVDDILPGGAVCALVRGRQVAIFRPGAGSELFALDNVDPFSKASVLSRGIIGDRQGILKVASPIYKQSFDLRTGVCLDDAAVRVDIFAVRVSGGRVLVQSRTGGN